MSQVKLAMPGRGQPACEGSGPSAPVVHGLTVQRMLPGRQFQDVEPAIPVFGQQPEAILE